ncbi:unknown protein [Seminavis robusta]|uniref:Uncharacterized protein n=1 Tax=Seminavis robusta TaxID=568900 RepID=A0A9N8ELF5_9STRA|nr:unknown protein [Seminavis robusta]|eukprot:Sro1348_g264990.1 n/a (166) ;mRNA; f:6511-7008
MSVNYTPGDALLIKSGPESLLHQIVVFKEPCEDNTTKCVVHQLTSVEELILPFASVQKLCVGNYFRMLGTRMYNAPLIQAEDIARAGAWSFANERNHAVVYRTPSPESNRRTVRMLLQTLTDQEARLDEIYNDRARLREQVSALENRVQELENFLHEQDVIPTGL